MKTNSFLIGCIFFLSQHAHCWNVSTDSFQNWSKTLIAKPGVKTELSKFFIDQDINPNTPDVQAYIPAFIQQTHHDYLQKVSSLLADSENQNLKCNNQTEIDFPEHITDFKIGEEFESQALTVESMDCLGQLNIHKVFSTLLSDQFQKKSVSGLQSILTNETTNQVCQQTSVFPIGKSDYCFTQNIWKNDTTYVIQSFNELNNNKPSAMVYFREVFTVIKQLKSGEVFIYNIVLGRGPDLPMHFIVKSTVKSQQQTMIQQLIQDSK